MRAKTLHITNSWHPQSGGIRTFYNALMQYANQHNRAMTLVVPASESGAEDVGKHGRIYYIRARPTPVGDPQYRVMWPWGASGREIRRILRLERPDLVEISDRYTLPFTAGLLRMGWIQGAGRPKLAGTSHERMDDNLEAYLFGGSLSRWIARTWLKRCYWPMFDHHVANSDYTAAELTPAFSGSRVYRPLHVMPMGVDCTGLDPAQRTPAARCALAQRAGAGCDVKLLVYAGRLAAEKNLPLLLETLERLGPGYHLVVAGTGMMGEWLDSEGRLRAPGRLHRIGHLPTRSDLAALYAGADVFVHPNPREPFGIAPLEAMAAGVPVVAPQRGGILSYASDRNAWLAEPNCADFARCVKEVFRDEQDRARRTAAARETALAYSWPVVAGRYFQLWDEIVGEAPHCGGSNCVQNRFDCQPELTKIYESSRGRRESQGFGVRFRKRHRAKFSG